MPYMSAYLLDEESVQNKILEIFRPQTVPNARTEVVRLMKKITGLPVDYSRPILVTYFSATWVKVCFTKGRKFYLPVFAMDSTKPITVFKKRPIVYSLKNSNPSKADFQSTIPEYL
jgi:hypothetical protein